MARGILHERPHTLGRVRRFKVAAFAATILLPLAAPIAVPAARAEAPSALGPARRVVLVTLDGTRLTDWRDPRLTNLNALLREGAVALLSTRTATVEFEPVAMREAAYRTLGSGAFADEPDPTLLADTLTRRGSSIAVLGGAVGEDTADRAAVLVGTTERASPPAARPDASFPTGMRTDYPNLERSIAEVLDGAGVLLVDTGDTARVERALGHDPGARAPWMDLALKDADAFIGRLRRSLTSDVLLMVASLTAPRERQTARRFLTQIVAVGPAAGPGTLTSATTRIDGVVSLVDLAPTILDALEPGGDLPAMTGRPVSGIPGSDAPTRIASLEHDYVHAAVVRSVLVRSTLLAAMALIAASFLLILTGRGKSTSGRGLPRTGRGLLQTGTLTTVAMPLALLVEPVLGCDSRAGAAAGTFGLAAALALACRTFLGTRASFAAILGTTSALALGDLALGGGLAARSPLSFLVAEGVRFHGIGNETMGVVVAASLIAVAWALDRRTGSRMIVAGALGLAAAAAVMASPWAGAKFGSVPASVPAFGLMLVLATSGRLTFRRTLLILIVAVLAAGIAAAADSLRDPAAQSHVGRAIGEPGGAGDIIGRKLGAAGRLLAASIWMGALALFAGFSAVLVWRRSDLLGRALWGSPATRAALIACAVAAVAAVATNDAGVTAAGWIALLAAGSLFSHLLAPDQT
jgi:hypothetical protein